MPQFTDADRLEALATILNELKLKITHIHEDLCFAEHNHFLFWLDPDEARHAVVYFNQECAPEERGMFEEKLATAVENMDGFDLFLGGSYTLEQDGEDEMKLELYDEIEDDEEE